MNIGNHLRAASAALTIALALGASPAHASRIITNVGADYATGDYSFTVGTSTFTFSGTGDIFAPTAVETGGSAEFNTIFGMPTSYFVDRGTVTFGPGDQYAAFPTATTIPFSNGDNFIGLRAENKEGKIFYGYAFTTNSVLNSYGFENVAGRAVTATVAMAVPEAANWMMMVAGFGAIGAALRRRRPSATVAFA